MKRSPSSAIEDAAVIAPSIPERILRLARPRRSPLAGRQPTMPDGLHVFVRQWVEDVLCATCPDDDADPGIYGTVSSLYPELLAHALAQVPSADDAAQRASDELRDFLTWVCDHTPEDAMAVKDVALAFLKVDQEYFSGRLRGALVAELLERRILTPADLRAFNERELQRPALGLPSGEPALASEVAQLLHDRADALGLCEPLGLTLLTLRVDADGRACARVALTFRGAETQNHGLAIFRASGALMDWHTPLPRGLEATAAAALFHRAAALGMFDRGVVSAISRPEGGFTARAAEPRGTGRAAHFMVFTLEHPDGVPSRSLRPPQPMPAFSLFPGGELLTG